MAAPDSVMRMPSAPERVEGLKGCDAAYGINIGGEIVLPLQVTDPTGPIADPNNPVLSRELYEQILHYATIPVLLFLIWFSWFLINRLMNPERRQERRNREIRKAVAERQALREQQQQEAEPPEN